MIVFKDSYLVLSSNNEAWHSFKYLVKSALKFSFLDGFFAFIIIIYTLNENLKT